MSAPRATCYSSSPFETFFILIFGSSSSRTNMTSSPSPSVMRTEVTFSCSITMRRWPRSASSLRAASTRSRNEVRYLSAAFSTFLFRFGAVPGTSSCFRCGSGVSSLSSVGFGSGTAARFGCLLLPFFLPGLSVVVSMLSVLLGRPHGGDLLLSEDREPDGVDAVRAVLSTDERRDRVRAVEPAQKLLLRLALPGDR